MRLPIPKGLERRMRPLIERGQRFLREWEWTWTKAILVGMGIAVFVMTTLVIIPSYMLYFADQVLHWRGRGLLTVRDIIVNGELGTFLIILLFVMYKLQVIRRRLRGERQAERYSGGYR